MRATRSSSPSTTAYSVVALLLAARLSPADAAQLVAAAGVGVRWLLNATAPAVFPQVGEIRAPRRARPTAPTGCDDRSPVAELLAGATGIGWIRRAHGRGARARGPVRGRPGPQGAARHRRAESSWPRTCRAASPRLPRTRRSPGSTTELGAGRPRPRAERSRRDRTPRRAAGRTTAWMPSGRSPPRARSAAPRSRRVPSGSSRGRGAAAPWRAVRWGGGRAGLRHAPSRPHGRVLALGGQASATDARAMLGRDPWRARTRPEVTAPPHPGVAPAPGLSGAVVGGLETRAVLRERSSATGPTRSTAGRRLRGPRDGLRHERGRDRLRGVRDCCCAAGSARSAVGHLMECPHGHPPQRREALRRDHRSRRSRPRGPRRLLRRPARPQRRGQVDHDADAHRAGDRRRGRDRDPRPRAAGESKAARAQCGVVPQLDNLDVTLTVEQNLLVFTYLYRVERRERRPRSSAHWRSRGSATGATRRSTSSAAACAGGCSSPGRSCTGRGSCCSTSRPSAWTRRCARSCGRCSGRCAARASRCSCRRTTSRRRSGSPTR